MGTSSASPAIVRIKFAREHSKKTLNPSDQTQVLFFYPDLSTDFASRITLAGLAIATLIFKGDLVILSNQTPSMPYVRMIVTALPIMLAHSFQMDHQHAAAGSQNTPVLQTMFVLQKDVTIKSVDISKVLCPSVN